MSDNQIDFAPAAPPKNTWYWMKNSNGQASASLTFASVSFIVITLWMLLSIFETITFGDSTLKTREPPTEGLIFAYLGTTFSLYFGRRYVDRSSQVMQNSTGRSNQRSSSSNITNNNSGTASASEAAESGD